MTKKRWAILLLFVLLIFGYIKVFYKTYSEKLVPQSASNIVVVDVKKIINTIAWQFITTPSRWKAGNPFKKSSKKVTLLDIFKLPDYVLAFQVKDSANDAWHCVLDIKNEPKLFRVLADNGFVKTRENVYAHEASRITLLIHSGHALLSWNFGRQPIDAAKIASELWISKKFISTKVLQEAIDANAHAALYIPAGNILDKGAVVALNFDKKKISVQGKFECRPGIAFSETAMLVGAQEVAKLELNKPPAGLLSMIDDQFKRRFYTVSSLNLDSLTMPGIDNYSVAFTGMTQRTDTIVSFSYDEEFNAVEQKNVQVLQEPILNIYIKGKDVNGLMHYFKNNDKLEMSANGALFRPIPLQYMYCKKVNDQVLLIGPGSYRNASTYSSVKAVGMLQVNFAKIPKELLKLLPEHYQQKILLLQNLNVVLTRHGNAVKLNGTLTKINADEPWF